MSDSDAQVLYDGLGYLYKVASMRNGDMVIVDDETELEVHVRLPSGDYVSLKTLVRIYLGGTPHHIADYPGLEYTEGELK
jgi:hypothetical protein